MGRGKSISIAFRATFGRLAYQGTGKRRRCTEGCGLRRSRKGCGGLWLSRKTKTKTHRYIVTRRERQTRPQETCHRTRKRRTSKATPISLVDEPNESSKGTRPTETTVLAPKNVNVQRDVPLTICSFCSLYCTSTHPVALWFLGFNFSSVPAATLL